LDARRGRAHATGVERFDALPRGVIVLALSDVAWSQPQPVTWLSFIDDLHLQFVETGRLRSVLRAIGREGAAAMVIAV
jgi:hypothetical protein